MSTLTALKLHRELKITRVAMATVTKRPALVLVWAVDPETRRAVATWTAQAAIEMCPTGDRAVTRDADQA